MVAGYLPEEQIEEVDRHPREVGQHNGGSSNQPPTADPADHRAERPRRPGKGRTAVRLGRVQLAIAQRYQQHWQETDDEHRRQVSTDFTHGWAEGASEGVDRCNGGDTQDNARQQSKPARGQPFGCFRCTFFLGASLSHTRGQACFVFAHE
ncbi:hypothetical protein D9M71_433130 [compost metagenome]